MTISNTRKSVFNSLLTLGMFLLLGGIVHSQEIAWGDEPGEGDFDGGLNGWTTQGITDDSHVWQWDEDGNYDNYTYVDTNGDTLNFTPFRTNSIDSETASNGAVIFKGEKRVREMFDGTIPGPPPYGNYESELISPVIDLSGTEAVILEFSSLLVALNANDGNPTGSNAAVSFKIDDGEWSEDIFITNPNDQTVTLNERIFIPGGAGAESFQVKFTYQQDFYYWMIDDVKIIDDPVSSDVSVTEPFYTPGAYAQPEFAIQYDTMYWQFNVGQAFARPANNLSASITVTRDSDGEVLYEDSKDLAPLAPATTRVDSFEELWAPPEDMEIGLYTVTYEVSDSELNEDDLNTDNNTFSYKFEVTSNSYRTDNGVIEDLIPSREADPVWVGNLYRWPADIQGTYYIDSIETAYGVQNEDVDVTDHVFSLLWNRVNDDILSDFSNYMVDAETPDRDGEQQTVLGINTVFIEEYEPNVIESFSVNDPTSPGTELSMEDRMLEPGSRYFLWVGLPDGSTNPGSGVACSVRPASADVPVPSFQPGLHIGQYFFGGFTSGTRTPVLRLNIVTMVDTDEPQLDANVLKAFPNPASTLINAEISFDEPTDLTLVVLDMTGKVHDMDVQKGVTEKTIQKDISNLSAGTYIMRVVTDNGVRNVKFIKQ